MSEYKLLIDGQLVEGKGSILEVINPADESLVATVATASPEQLASAINGAKLAFSSWSQTPIAERQNCLRRLVTLLKDNADDLAELLVKEQGKPLDGANMEMTFAEVFTGYFSEQGVAHKVLIDDEVQKVELVRKPLGVVAGITPWNFPFVQAVYKLAPAVLTGNTIIIKPSPMTPLTTLRLGELANQVFPAGVVNVLADNNDLGPVLCAHDDIAKVTFTGSTPTGRKIMAAGADTLKRLTLELGGNDAGIVLDDADPKEVAPGIFATAFMNSGQVCAALKRLYVHDSIYDAVCDEIAGLAKAAVVGDGSDPRTQFGPVQNRAQYEKVCAYIADAKAHGNVIAGGTIPEGPGFILPLTVVRDIEDGTAVVDEEPFGPILPIIRYTDLEDAIKCANGSEFGLGGSVWSSNIERAQAVAARLECGSSWINQHAAFAPNIPFPTCKQSGVGVEWGSEGIEEFTRVQVINTAKQ
ncbi:aldehyde dehydrogenase family protein [Pseudomaricurvus alkylphenolicus]|uniref:aldehyde dehydrogenase family protein n=1 Tax=Pseudomaricurvus alkylphenolicus TaxID=1306991 RepID=UPI001423C734|nr:aldehyde dehydrogenase family protein [Pseudomaricurvus alkylphenolicus]NIB38379.1 aldehyde dehydrogenase family protein [Pseudomaricurvus alkylphenolicus]